MNNIFLQIKSKVQINSTCFYSYFQNAHKITAMHENNYSCDPLLLLLFVAPRHHKLKDHKCSQWCFELPYVSPSLTWWVERENWGIPICNFFPIACDFTQGNWVSSYNFEKVNKEKRKEKKKRRVGMKLSPTHDTFKRPNKFGNMVFTAIFNVVRCWQWSDILKRQIYDCKLNGKCKAILCIKKITRPYLTNNCK